MSFDLNVSDGQSHQLTLALLDWDGRGARNEKIEVKDGATGALLDSRSATAFANVTYLTWTVTGRIKIVVTNLNPASNAVVSGIFLD